MHACRWGYDNLAFLEKAKAVDAAGYGVTSNKWRAAAGVAYIILAIKVLMDLSCAGGGGGVDGHIFDVASSVDDQIGRRGG